MPFVARYLAVAQLAVELITVYIIRFCDLRLGASAAAEPHEDTDLEVATHFIDGVLGEYRPTARGILHRMIMDDPLLGPHIHLDAFFLEVD
ncbi:hypothetical protein ACS0TY_026468 [Phlomoides rotata]